MTTEVAQESWSGARRFAFRWAFLFVLFLLVPEALLRLHAPQWLGDLSYDPWYSAGVWTGHHLFGIPASFDMLSEVGGGADRRVDFIVFGLQSLVSLLAAITWSALDPRRVAYPTLYRGLRTFVRYMLALAMFGYGVSKLLRTQFPAPLPDMLYTRLGDLPPDRLFWNFIGASPLYQMFGGVAEIAGALLLLFRRTTTLGALITAAVMTNVFVLNLSYDVGVKLYSATLLCLALFLLLRDAYRLAELLLLQRAPAPFNREPPAWTPRRRWVRSAVKAILLAMLLEPVAARYWKKYKAVGEGAPRNPLAGVYEVESFTRNGDDVPPLVTDPFRWRRFAIANSSWTAVQQMDDSWMRWRTAIDGAHQVWSMKPMGESNLLPATLHYQALSPEEFALSGVWQSSSIEVRLKRIPDAKLKLLSQPPRLFQD